LDRLSDCAGTLSPGFYWIDAPFSGGRLVSSVSGAPSLYASIGLRRSNYIGPAPLGILDRNGPGTSPDRSPMVCPSILLAMKLLLNRFVLLNCLVALPLTLFAGALQTVTLDVKNMTCAVCPITVKNALEKVAGVTRARVDFDKKTASVTFDPDKTNPASLAKASLGAGYPSSVHN
jgi:periplasmic mercuric ion binding protein